MHCLRGDAYVFLVCYYLVVTDSQTRVLFRHVLGEVPPNLQLRSPKNFCHVGSYNYTIWSVIQQRVYDETRVHDIDELQQHLLHVWCSLELQQSLIDDAVDQCPTPLRACVRARDGHFEHTLWLSICLLST